MDRSTIKKLVQRETSSIKQSLTAEDLFTSSFFQEYIENLATAITRQYEERIEVTSYFDPKSPVTAFTSSRDITLNTGNDLITSFTDLDNKFAAATGMLYHEISHILYLDFNFIKTVLLSLSSGHLFGEGPDLLTQEEEDLFQEMLAYLQDEAFRPIFTTIAGDYLNIMADPRDEDQLMKDLHGDFVFRCIQILREALQISSQSYLQMKQSGITDLALMENLILQYARSREIIIEDEALFNTSEDLKVFKKIMPSIDKARGTYNSEIIAKSVNEVLFFLFPMIKKALEDQQAQNQENDQSEQNENGSPSGSSTESGNNGSSKSEPSDSSQNSSSQSSGSQEASDPKSGSSSGGQNNSASIDEQVKEILDQLKEAAENSGKTTAPEGQTSKTAIKKLFSKDEQSTKEYSDGKSSKETFEKKPDEHSSQEKSSELDRVLDHLLRKIAKQKAEDMIEEKIQEDTLSEIRTVSMNSSHIGRSIDVLSFNTINPSDRQTYNNVMASLNSYSKRLQKRMLEALREQQGYIAHKRPAGKIFEARNAYRPDQRYYAKKTLPSNLSMAISVLVDHSGSMNSTRIYNAMQAAMLMYDFSSALDIPIAISGHNTSKTGINYIQYTEFEKVGPNQKYSLTKMPMLVGSRNRDGMAIEVAAHLLEKRPEEIRLLLIISDGQPNDENYGGEAAADDIRSIVKKYRRKGIDIVAAAIGDDKERIKEIYGSETYLNISDLSTLPKTLVKLVAKRIVT